MNDFDPILGVPFSGSDEIWGNQAAIPCTREDEAAAIAAGAFLAGKKPMVYLQNSGLGHIIDVVTSLLIPYQIKVAFSVKNRTKPVHHEFMGLITHRLVDLLGIEGEILANE